MTTRTCPACGEQHEELELMRGWHLRACGGLVSTEDVVFAFSQRLTNAEGRERVWAEQWAAVRDEAERLRHALEAITGEFERAVHELDRPRGGQSVRPTGDFVDALRLPSFASRVRWWARRLRSVLAYSAPKHSPSPTFAADGSPVLVEASGVEVVGTAKPGSDA